MIRRKRLKTGNEGWLTSYADLITNLLIFFILIIAASEVKIGKLESIASSFSKNKSAYSLYSAQEDLKREIEAKNISKFVEVQLTDSGLELSFNSGITFTSGSSMILPQMIEPMKSVLKMLLPYGEKYHFAVEGHTDEVPIKKDSVFKSNWDLAAARALTVRDYLEDIGLEKNKIKVESYADTKPLEMKDLSVLNYHEKLAKHRRVVIRVY